MDNFGPGTIPGVITQYLPTVLGFAGAAIVAAVVGTMLFIGVNKGIRWALLLLGGYRYDKDTGAWMGRGSGFDNDAMVRMYRESDGL